MASWCSIFEFVEAAKPAIVAVVEAGVPAIAAAVEAVTPAIVAVVEAGVPAIAAAVEAVIPAIAAAVPVASMVPCLQPMVALLAAVVITVTAVKEFQNYRNAGRQN
nr:hypothetical protein CFP56_23391 [Quercus suber]